MKAPAFSFLKLCLITLLFFQSYVFALSDTNPTSENVVTVNPDTIDTNGETEGQSELANNLCTLILMFNGRAARVIAAVAIFAVGILFFLGKITWPVIVTVAVAMGLVFGAKVIAIALLPRVVHTYDATQNETQTTTTSEIISQACPELL